MLNDQTPKQRWLDEALTQIPVDLKTSNGTAHRQIIGDYLRPLLKRCRATSRSRFWQWLRLQLSKSEEMSGYLMWTRESKCAPELPIRSEIPYTLSADGAVALIAVGDEKTQAVWRVPVSRLSWALSMFPVYLKTLPAVESENNKQIRKLRRELKCKTPYLTPAQRADLIHEIEQWESRSTVDTSSPRYQLMKSTNGRDIPVHRLFVDAESDDHVEAVDGDFLNFATTTVRITVENIAVKGVVVRKGDRPLNESFVSVVPNLMIVNNDDSQQKFDREMTQLSADLKKGLQSPDDLPPAKSTGRTLTTKQYDNRADADRKTAVFNDAGIPFEPWSGTDDK